MTKPKMVFAYEPDPNNGTLPPLVPARTPTPTPQPDHGAAGFCTNHTQAAPDERVETVAWLTEIVRVEMSKGAYQMLPDELPYESSARRVTAAVVAALDGETARLRASADAWWSEYDRELTAHEATKAEVERLARIVNGYDRTPAEQRATDVEAERDALRAECRDTWRMFEAAKAQRDEARKDGAGFWPALAGQNDRDAWTFMAERDTARAALDRVRAVADEWEAGQAVNRAAMERHEWFPYTAPGPADLRAALDPEEPR